MASDRSFESRHFLVPVRCEPRAAQAPTVWVIVAAAALSRR